MPRPIQSRSEHQRERVRLATQLAIEDQKAELELVKMMSVKEAELPHRTRDPSCHVRLPADMTAAGAAGAASEE